ncbi:hypothetical protein BDZ45DRAFT_671883 [Acephala macrosclerotiorum]|nr:hypothetical protein BDZ45DRAFT_671883 [Acephala macrosclerotiorum]
MGKKWVLFLLCGGGGAGVIRKSEENIWLSKAVVDINGIALSRHQKLKYQNLVWTFEESTRVEQWNTEVKRSIITSTLFKLVPAIVLGKMFDLRRPLVRTRIAAPIHTFSRSFLTSQDWFQIKLINNIPSAVNFLYPTGFPPNKQYRIHLNLAYFRLLSIFLSPIMCLHLTAIDLCSPS